MPKLRDFFKVEDQAAIKGAIESAEKKTSGEIRIRVEKRAGRDPVAKAMEAFEKIGMRLTDQRNGILFYISIQDRKFAIIGDDAINEKVPSDFWENVKNAVIEKFKAKQFAIGLIGGINIAGEKLAEYFPFEREDVNELSNSLSFEDEDER